MSFLTFHQNQKKPPGNGRQQPPWRIALIANLKHEVTWGPDAPPDAGAEFDRRETVEAIAQALDADGHQVFVCRGDRSLPNVLAQLRPHICFNVAEGIDGDAREAQVPALCELLGIPYTASRVQANAVSLDKTLTKRIWRDHGLPTAPFQEFCSATDPIAPDLTFPLFVKPSREGTGMGVDQAALVHDEPKLRERIAWVLQTYRQPALVETFLPGREFTVGYLGNPGAVATGYRPWLYDSQGYHFFPVLEIDSRPSVSPGIYGHDAKGYDIGAPGAPAYLCPAHIAPELQQRLIEVTRRAAEAIGACDVSRVDLRLDADGEPQLLEINTLPGLNPAVSDLCIMAAAEGMPYETLITEITYQAAARFGLPFEKKHEPDARVFAPARKRRRVPQTANSGWRASRLAGLRDWRRRSTSHV